MYIVNRKWTARGEKRRETFKYSVAVEKYAANSKLKTRDSPINLSRCHHFRVGQIFDIWGSPLHYREYATEQFIAYPIQRH